MMRLSMITLLACAGAFGLGCGDDKNGAAGQGGGGSGGGGAGSPARDAAVDGPRADGPPRSDGPRGDAPRADARPADAPRAPDAAPPDAPPRPDGPLMPTMLSQTGLYDDIPSGRLAPGVRAYEVRFPLWSDGATKKRWVYLPPGSQIDTSDMDYWKYPAGTKLWKEFTRDGKRVETRLLYKTGADSTSWFMMAFLWNDAQTDAMAAPDGMDNAGGTQHDVPAQLKCLQCHNGLPDRALGFAAIQLAQDVGEVNLGVLQREGRLTASGAATYPLPGDATAQAALGYMHGNCGGCHNPRSSVHVLVDMELRLPVAGLSAVAMTPAYRTTVNVVPGMPYMGDTHRITPGDPATSAVHVHMSGRSNTMMTWKQMPPIGTEVVDMTGLAAVDAWITAVR